MSLSQGWCFWILSQVSVATSTILTVFEGYDVPQDADLPALTSQRSFVFAQIVLPAC